LVLTELRQGSDLYLQTVYLRLLDTWEGINRVRVERLCVALVVAIGEWFLRVPEPRDAHKTTNDRRTTM
jgi:hypothetical protein